MACQCPCGMCAIGMHDKCWGNCGGRVRIAAGLTQVEAEQFAACLLFRGRAMPDKEET